MSSSPSDKGDGGGGAPLYSPSTPPGATVDSCSESTSPHDSRDDSSFQSCSQLPEYSEQPYPTTNLPGQGPPSGNRLLGHIGYQPNQVPVAGFPPVGSGTALGPGNFPPGNHHPGPNLMPYQYQMAEASNGYTTPNLVGNTNAPPGYPYSQLNTGMAGMSLDARTGYQHEKFQIQLARNRINGLSEAAKRQDGLSTQFATQLAFELMDINRTLGRVSYFVDNQANALNQKSDELERVQATVGLQAAEIQKQNHDMEHAERNLRSAERRFRETEESYQLQLDSMEEQSKRDAEKIKLFEDQLARSRQLFGSEYSDTRAQSNSMEIQRASSYNNILGSEPGSASRSSRMGSPAHALVGPSRPTPPYQTSGGRGYARQRPRPTSANRNPYTINGSSSRNSGVTRYQFDDGPGSSSRQVITRGPQDLGSPTPMGSRHSLADAIDAPNELHVKTWQEHIGLIWEMVQTWCNRYAKNVRHDDVTNFPERAPKLWEYILEILYVGQPESAASHATYLLQDQASRVHLVERLMMQYLVNTVWTVESWGDFSPEMDAKLDTIKKDMLGDGSRVFEHQSTIDALSAFIGQVMMHESFPSFRQRKEAEHSARLKTIVGPLMDTLTSRAEASFHLHEIAAKALQVSALMFQSRLAFSFVWDDTCSKFNADVHQPVDKNLDPLSLQMRQWRLKLVVSPAVALRDTNGMGITPRRVMRADVLVMN